MPNIPKVTAVPAAPANTPAPAPLPPSPTPVRRPRRPAPMADALKAAPGVLAALRSAADVWSFPGPAESYDDTFKRVERDARDANASKWMDGMRDEAAAKARELPVPAAKPTREDRATAQALANLPLVQAAYARPGWDSIREMRCDQLKALIAADPMAVLAWQALLITGKLDRTAEPAHDGRTLYEHLVGLLKAPLAPGLDRASLVADLIQELADPVCIAQQMRSSCTVTSLQIMLVADRPAEYARLVAGLASVGAVSTIGGAVLIRDDIDPAKCGRTQSSALFQAACMELGNGPIDYLDAKDESGPVGTILKFPSRGLGPEALKTVLEAITGGQWDYHAANTTAQGGLMSIGSKELPDPAVVAAKITAIVNGGRPVVAGLTWASDLQEPRAALSGHAILVTGVRDGRVFYANPHGALESMAEADFVARLRGFHAEARD